MRRFLTTRKEQPERVLVIGTGPSACRIATALEAGPRSCSIVGFVTEEGDPRIASGTLRLPRPVLGNLSEMTAIIDSVRPARVIVALGKLRDRIPMQQLMQCVARGVAVEGALQAYERLNGKLELEHMTPGDLLSSNLFCESAHLRPQQEAIARAISLTVAALGLIITAPLIVLVAILIKIDSPGPALFVQKRIGLDGRRFNLLKFRTMTEEKQTNSKWVCDNADRVTRVGQWIRKFWLDELLQLINILRGDMNLVGPRPHPVSNRKLFSTNIPYYGLRATVRPGLTGWAQLRNGYANNLEQEIEKMRYDMYYIKNRSLWLDLRIIVETVKVVLFGLEASPPPLNLHWKSIGPSAYAPDIESEAREEQPLLPGFGADGGATDYSGAHGSIGRRNQVR